MRLKRRGLPKVATNCHVKCGRTSTSASAMHLTDITTRIVKQNYHYDNEWRTFFELLLH